MPAKYATPDDVADVADLANRLTTQLGRIEQRLAVLERILAVKAAEAAATPPDAQPEPAQSATTRRRRRADPPST
jgi:hypothetical protein